MDKKLNDLLDKIEFNSEDYKYFDDGKILKVTINNKEKSWTISLSLLNVLHMDTYNQLINNIKEKFNLNSVLLNIDVKNKDYSLMAEYWDLLIELMEEKSQVFKLIKGREIKWEDNKLIIDVHNKNEKNNFDTYLKEMKKLYSMFGFDDIEIDSVVDETKSNVVKEEITKDLTKDLEKINKKSEEDSDIIMGNRIKNDFMPIKEIIGEMNNVTIAGFVFAVDIFESNKNNFKIITAKMTDYDDSIFVKIFIRDDEEFIKYKKKIKDGMWLKVSGYTKNDQYAKDIVLNARDINIIDNPKIITDDADKKRVELHAHTTFSRMDGLCDVKGLIKQAKSFGHKAVAITDHDGVQSFPVAFHAAKDIKVIYGVELDMINDNIDIVINERDYPFFDTTFVVFDFETTGFNAGNGDTIIEVGAVKIKDGEIIDRFSELIDPGREVPKKITEITGITTEDVKGKDNEETVIKRFIEWYGDLPMVAHNAKFDVSFLDMAYKKYDLGNFDNTVIDTLQLSRVMDSNYSRHGLSYIVKRYNVVFDESGHHRADYDAEGTALVFHKMLEKLSGMKTNNVININKIIDKSDIFKVGRGYHVNLIIQNETGLKNLFRLVSYANTKYFHKGVHILKSDIIKYREGILVGSSCYNGEVFSEAGYKSEEELIDIMTFYDYIEVQPLENYKHLVQTHKFEKMSDIEELLKKIINTANGAGKLVVATGDVHHLNESDKLYREIIINQNSPGGGRHPLNRKEITDIPTQHFRTTNEMLEGFPYLSKEDTYKYVVTNTNLVADMVDEIEIIKKGLFAPVIPNSKETVMELVDNKARELYGSELPEIIKARIKQELDAIIGNKFDVIYLIAQKLVKNSNDEGYLVGSRGSVGSSFVAFLMGITEVNALPAHYICPNCKKSIFDDEDDVPYGHHYSSGYDLPDRKCECGTMMNKEGQDMPFATFLGFKGDKTPDIDLNFSGDYQARAHDYTKVLFGEKNVLRAGTVGTVAEKTAYGFVLGYYEDHPDIPKPRTAHIEFLAGGCTGVKRTNGQHPGGIIVFPDDKDMFEVTPYQYPADDPTSQWYTMHFEYHALEDNLLKLDILGHDDPTVIKMLEDISGIDVLSIKFDDQKVMEIFRSPKVLGVTEEQILCPTGTLGIPEFGTDFVIKMLTDTEPKSFGELIKISGLSHGTDVWLNNAQNLVIDGTCDFKDVIGCRDDIMVYLMNEGLEPIDAFKIMEFVRKGKLHWSGDMVTWLEYAEIMKEKSIPDWYIESCKRIKYMFPKAHATAYVMMAFRVAWFKVHHPIYYYSAFFSVRAEDFDIDAMIGGYDKIKARIAEIVGKGYDATNKENAILGTLKLALEATARGFKFGNIDLWKSDSSKFIIDEDNKTLIPPFRSIDGLGMAVAEQIIKERDKGPFVSIEDTAKRCKISTTIVEKMRNMNMFGDLPESSQLSLF